MWRKKHRAGPSFANVAVAGDVNGECISEQDLIQDKGNGGNGPDWGQLPSQYTVDGCVDEAEFNLIMQGLGIKHARAVGEYLHRFSVCLPCALHVKELIRQHHIFVCQAAHASAPYHAAPCTMHHLSAISLYSSHAAPCFICFAPARVRRGGCHPRWMSCAPSVA
jgi:hypothetical protein